MRPSRLIRQARRHAARHRFDHLTLEGRDSPSSTDEFDDRVSALDVALRRMEDADRRANSAA